MVRRSLPAWSLAALTFALAAPAAATVAPVQTPAPVSGGPRAHPAAPAPKAISAAPTGQPVHNQDWRERVAAGVEALRASDPALLDRLTKLLPDRTVEGVQYFSQPEANDPRATPVFLHRLSAGNEPVQVRRALAEALPDCGGDWQEAAAALIATDPSPLVRKQLVEDMRYAAPPHSVDGLRLGFKDPDPEVNVAAARTTGFSKSSGELLYAELYSSTFDVDWDLRAAAVQAFGMLRLDRSREVLIKALGDDDREVRLQALLALEQLDPEGLLHLPQLEALAKDRKSHRISRMATQLLRKRDAQSKSQRKAVRQRQASAGSGTIAPAP